MALFAVSCYVLPAVYNAQFLSIEKTTSLAEPVNHELLASMRSGAAGQFTGVPARPAHENDAIPKIAPKWLKHDRQVRKNQNSSLDKLAVSCEAMAVSAGRSSLNFFIIEKFLCFSVLLDAII